MMKRQTALKRKVDVSCFVAELMPGGAQRAVVKLVNGFADRGLGVDLVLANKEGPHVEDVEATVRVIDLAAGRVVKAIPALSRYLRRERPGTLVSVLTHANLAAITARAMSRVKTRVMVVEQNTVTQVRSHLKRDALLPALVRRSYAYADHVVAVSGGVANDLIANLGIPASRVSVIPNPVVDNDLDRAAMDSPNHQWFDGRAVPVFVAAGRLSKQKDFPTLIRAFDSLRKTMRARLIIMGEGEERPQLEKMIARLGLTDHVALPGYLSNPYSVMSRGAAFVLSSRWEGLPTVLIEAMACGCPIVATDCPSGPREILDGGRYGKLVPIGDSEALCKAMQEVLQHRPSASLFRQRAGQYSINDSVASYLRVLGLSEDQELDPPAREVRTNMGRNLIRLESSFLTYDHQKQPR